MSGDSVLNGRTPVAAAMHDTQEHILEVALHLMQTGGYHAFSYADVAAEVGVTKASIHYHYPAKADLGRAVLSRYRAGWLAQLQTLDAASGHSGLRGAEVRLRGYSRLHRDLLRGGRLCLVAALAPESRRLPGAMLSELQGFYAEHEGWLLGVLEAGRKSGAVSVRGPLQVHAQALLSALHGAQGLARVQGDVYRYCAVAHLTLAGLGLPFTELEITDPAAFEAQAAAHELETELRSAGLALV